MNKAKINYFIDLVAVLFFLICAGSGLIMLFFLPEGIRHGGTQEFLGLSKNVWVDIHDFSGVIIIILVLVHLILHWNWLECMTNNIFCKNKTSCEKTE